MSDSCTSPPYYTATTPPPTRYHTPKVNTPKSHPAVLRRKLYGDQARFFDDELHPQLKHRRRGVVGMASAGPNLNASQFYITTGEELDSLDGKHTVFGQVGNRRAAK